MSSRHAPIVSVVEPSLLERTPHGFLHHVRSGRWLPPFISRQAVETLQATWDTCERDIFIATAQKVGTHLTKRFVVEILAELCHFPEGHPCHARDIGHGAVPWPEVTYSQYSAEGWNAHLSAVARGPRLWYLHCDVEDLPMRRVHPDSRFLVCYREPKSVCVSQFFFYKKHPLLGVDPSLSLDEFVELFLEGNLYFGDYFDHVRRWWELAQSRVGRLLWLRYEALVEDKVESARRIAGFLAPGQTLSEAKLFRVAERTGFEAMKEELTRSPQTFHFRPEVFFRAGTTDDWRNHLSDAQAARIDAGAERAWAGTTLLESRT